MAAVIWPARAADLLGGHVAGRPQDLAVLVSASSRSRSLARPKSVILGTPSSVEQDVGRLEVAVDDPALVGEVHGPGERLDQAGARGSCSVSASRRSSRLPRRIRGPGTHPLVFADLVDLDDVRVLEPGGGLGLGLEPRRGTGVRVGVGPEDLERNQRLRLPARPDRPSPCRRGPAHPGCGTRGR